MNIVNYMTREKVIQEQRAKVIAIRGMRLEGPTITPELSYLRATFPAGPNCPTPLTTVSGRRDLQQYQSQAKQLFRKLNEQSPTRCTLEAGAMAFHYIIEKGVCYLVLCEAAFPKKLAFAYLEDLHSEFDEQHGKRVPTVSRPYSFIEFDTYIQKTKKLYIDSRARRNLGSINTELQDVQRIMVANIEEVLQRGEALSALDSKANNLSSLSKKYRQDAKS
ncbi:vesicle-trafficking protein SEC22b [Apteryx rowi]|uniref:vesicle-trafficking protein SEC22b n=1 Tax=Apteryx rowi TaxID=308060 RepID=UPI000E1C52BD|nr:vesicle-trafficking protein SEC22b [Apteryx rowi]